MMYMDTLNTFQEQAGGQEDDLGDENEVDEDIDRLVFAEGVPLEG